MLSMTGFGFSELSKDSFYLSVEIKSYNSRYLEISQNLPPIFSRFESDINQFVKERIRRGKVELFIRFKKLESEVEVLVDRGLFSEYHKAFNEIKKLSDLDLETTLSDYIGCEGLLVTNVETDGESFKEELFSLLKEALDECINLKEKEGLATKGDLIHLINQFEDDFNNVSLYEKTLETKIKENLLERFEQLLGSKGYDENRFLQEVASLLVKYSINEELIRLKSHIKTFIELLNEQMPVGKRLDFLAQEMNREVNTIGSKNTIVEVSYYLVTMKESLENIREQLRNIE